MARACRCRTLLLHLLLLLQTAIRRLLRLALSLLPRLCLLLALESVCLLLRSAVLTAVELTTTVSTGCCSSMTMMSKMQRKWPLNQQEQLALAQSLSKKEIRLLHLFLLRRFLLLLLLVVVVVILPQGRGLLDVLQHHHRLGLERTAMQPPPPPLLLPSRGRGSSCCSSAARSVLQGLCD